MGISQVMPISQARPRVREETGTYNTVFGGKKEDIGPLNTHVWDVYRKKTTNPIFCFFHYQ